MARRSKKQAELETLTRQLDYARGELGRGAIVLRGRLDVPSRIKCSIRQNRARWFGASLVVGLIASLGLRRLRHRHRHRPPGIETKATVSSRGKLAGIAAAAFTLLRPLLQKWLLHKMRHRL